MACSLKGGDWTSCCSSQHCFDSLWIRNKVPSGKNIVKTSSNYLHSHLDKADTSFARRHPLPISSTHFRAKPHHPGIIDIPATISSSVFKRKRTYMLDFYFSNLFSSSGSNRWEVTSQPWPANSPSAASGRGWREIMVGGSAWELLTYTISTFRASESSQMTAAPLSKEVLTCSACLFQATARMSHNRDCSVCVFF